MWALEVLARKILTTVLYKTIREENDGAMEELFSVALLGRGTEGSRMHPLCLPGPAMRVSL